MRSALLRRQQDAIREHEQRFKLLVEQSPGVVYIDAIDDTASTLYISPRIEQLTGYAPREWRDDPDLWPKLLHPEDRERALELTDLGLLVDTGHLLIAGADPVAVLRDFRERVSYVHVKDVRMDVLRGAVAEGVDMLEAWRRGIFCELGTGDVELERFLAELRAGGYDGWVVVEQDRIPRPDEPLAESAEAQARNRRWLRERAGV